MTDTKDVQNGEVFFVGWNMAFQYALDREDNIWNVGGWHDETKELPMYPYGHPDFAEHWEEVKFVTVFLDTPDGRKWATLFPDDFTGRTEG